MKTGFAETICKLRKERKISQRKAADDLGVSQALLSHYENGVREPRLPFVRAMADYYGVSVDFILGGQDACVAIEHVRGAIDRALTLAQDTGGDDLALAAANYLLAAADYLASVLDDPNRPYDVKRQLEMKSAESELFTAAREEREERG